MLPSIIVRMLCIVTSLLLLVPIAHSQTTVYNNFGPEHGGWDYNYSLGWTVAGVSVPEQYGVEQAMSFQSRVNGTVTDIWVAFFYVPSSALPDTVTIKLCHNPQGLPPEPGDIIEEWIITEFFDWYQWDPPHHLVGNGHSQIEAGQDYWLWAVGGETTNTGWCMNIDPSLTCPHTLRREGENWLPVANETASAFRVDVGSAATDFSLLPADFSLLQAYPNPFNPSTLIRFQVQIAGEVQLKVYNPQGNIISTLTDGWQIPGSYQIPFDASHLSSGIYLARLAAGDFTQTQKLVLIK